MVARAGLEPASRATLTGTCCRAPRAYRGIRVRTRPGRRRPRCRAKGAGPTRATAREISYGGGCLDVGGAAKAVHVLAEIDIDRPDDQVAEYAADPDKRA